MRKNDNSMNIEGKIYQFDLTEKVTGENSKQPGTHYINGTLDVAIDKDQSNIVQVHYSYVAPEYSSGKTNTSYTAMEKIINSGKTVVTDAYGKVTEITATTIIIGGSYDRDLESTNITVKGDVKFKGIRAGSVRDGAEETPLHVGKITVNIEGVNRTSAGVTGSYGAVRTEEIEINIKDSKLSFCGAGESICNKNDANAQWGQNCSLASKAWIKKSNIILDNSFVDCAYAGANCGYMFGDDVNIVAKNGSSATWFLACGSNGATNKASAKAIDSTIEYMQTTNRGPVSESELEVKGSVVNYLFPTGDSTDKTVNGTVKKAKVEVDASSKVNLYPGTNGGEVITAEIAEEIIDVIKISRSADVTYMEDADKILANKIKIK
jgi:hypothetical protein